MTIINIDDLMATVNSAVQFCKAEVRKYEELHQNFIEVKSLDHARACKAHVRMFQQQAERTEALLKKLEDIHETGCDFVAGVINY
tara:strand:- start:822 stop:1076 length:255 start_codon:yes stop_codon:yes gene_type:complete